MPAVTTEALAAVRRGVWAVLDMLRPTTLAWLTIGVGLALRLAPIADDPLHPDECLYASWALAVRGGDGWLQGQVIDKPPAFPYLLALWSAVVGQGPTALRLLGATFSAVTMLLVFRIAHRAWGGCPAWAGLTLLALSPVAVALDATALTDPPAIALALGAVMAAVAGRSLTAGVLLGLAVATKPQLLLYAPAVLAAMPARVSTQAVKAAAGLAGVSGLVGMWEVVRSPRVGFIEAAVAHYGLGQRPAAPVADWLALARWIWGAWPAALLWGLVLTAGLVAASRSRSVVTGGGLALGVGASIFAYLSLHLALGAPAWDRYLLPLVPLASLLFAWALARLSGSLPQSGRPWLCGLAGLALAGWLWTPAVEASQGRLPLGDTSRWQGIEQVTDYVRGQVPGRATILHRDLGWHLSYYMAGFPQDFRWYQDRGQLVDECLRATPAYVLTTAEGPGMDDVAHLRERGFVLSRRHATYRRDGSPALLLYLVEERPDAS